MRSVPRLSLACFWLLNCTEQQAPAPPSPTEAAKEFCDAICNAALECGAPTETCGGCAAYAEGAAARIVPDVTRREAECIATAECGDDLSVTINECIGKVQGDVSPTTASVAFCEEMAKPFFECLYFATPTSCSWSTARLTERALKSGLACKASSCKELALCLDEKLWTFAGSAGAAQ
jgi:hypothetical protein